MSVVGPGTKVVCINGSEWTSPGPSQGAIVIVEKVLPQGEVFYCCRRREHVKLGCDFYMFVEWPGDAYACKNFRPLDGVDELIELCRDVKNPDAPAPKVTEPALLSEAQS